MTVEEMVNVGYVEMTVREMVENEYEGEFKERHQGDLNDELKQCTYTIRINKRKEVFISGSVFGAEEFQVMNNIVFLWSLAVGTESVEAVFAGIDNRIRFKNPTVSFGSYGDHFK